MKAKPKAKPKAELGRKRKPDTKAARAVETEPDAWERFTGAVKKIAKPKPPRS